MTAMRRRLLLLLVALALLGAACGGGSSGGGGAADASQCPTDALAKADGTVAIDYWFSGLAGANVDAMKALVAQYNSAQKKVRVNAQFQGTYDEGSNKYLTALRGSGLPEMIMLQETELQLMIDSKSVVPAQACVDSERYDLSDYLDAALNEFRVKDQLWPMPFNVSNPVLYYDTRDFEKAGLDPKNPPKTFDEVLAAARKIKASRAAKTGYAWEMQPWYVEQWFSKAGRPIVDQKNGRSGRAGKATLDSATGREVYDFAKTLFDEGLALNVGRNTSGADTLLALGKGDAGMTVATSAALGSIYAIQDAGQFTDVGVGVAPLFGPTSDTGGVTVGGGSLWIVGKGKSDVEKAAAWDFAKWLDEPAQQARWHKLTGYIPVRKSSVKLPEVAQLWKQRPTYRVAYDQLAASKADQGGPSIGPYKEFRDAIRTSLETLILKKADPAKALQQAQAGADEALSSYNDRIGG